MKLVDSSDPILTSICLPVENIDKQVLPYIEDMRKLMVDHGGIGLAAPQVGINLRFFIWELSSLWQNSWLTKICINPEIIRRGKDLIQDYEGCLSYPGKRLLIDRNRIITLRYTDECSKIHEQTYKNYEARIIQHELDHLDGITIIKV